MYQRTRTRQPYIYVVGAVGLPGARQTVMDLHADIREGAPERADALVALGTAVWLSHHGTREAEEAPPLPEGFTCRLVRLSVADYNRIVTRANTLEREGREALDVTGYHCRDAIHVLYLRKAAIHPDDPDVWDITNWAKVTQDFNMAEAPYPSPDPFRREPDFHWGPGDGQHRLN